MSKVGESVCEAIKLPVNRRPKKSVKILFLIVLIVYMLHGFASDYQMRVQRYNIFTKYASICTCARSQIIGTTWKSLKFLHRGG